MKASNITDTECKTLFISILKKLNEKCNEEKVSIKKDIGV